MRYSLDFETRSHKDLKRCGSYIYAIDSSTEILCACIYEKDSKRMYEYDMRRKDNSEFIDIYNSVDLFWAFNAEFEYLIAKYVSRRLGWAEKEIENFRCTQAMALSLNLPASLGYCAEALKVSEQKDTDGTRLIKKFSIIKEDNQHTLFDASAMDTDFDKLIKYCGQDTRTESAVLDALPSLNLSVEELKVYQHTIKLNERGIRVDSEYANSLNAFYTYKKNTVHLPAFLSIARKYDTTIYSPNQTAKVKKIVEDKLGIGLDSMDSSAVTTLLQKCKDGEVVDLLSHRKFLSASSIAKLKCISEMVDSDDRIHNILKYHKASTGRFSGTGLQIHNLPRNTEGGGNLKPLRAKILDGTYDTDKNFADVIKNLLRSLIIPSEGCKFIVADFSSIENRVMAWLSNDHKSMAIFEAGADQYKDMACSIFKVLYDDVTPEQRKEAKAVVLGCQYGMGSKKFAETTGLDIDRSTELVRAFRKKYVKLVEMWQNIYEIALESIQTPNKVFYYLSYLKIVTYKDYLFIRLPSGRPIAFPFVSIKETDYGHEGIHYKTMRYIDIAGRDSKSYSFSDMLLTPTLLSQNITQAVARDVLVDTMFRLEDNRFPVSFHVHDEVICEVTDIMIKQKLKIFNRIVKEKSDWYKKLPIEMEGEIHDNFGKT